MVRTTVVRRTETTGYVLSFTEEERLALVYECAHCSETSAVLVRFAVGDRLPEPWAPEGWRIVERQLVCPRHTVSVK